jgi:pimeloyl-ACP methyl ester carboxylesterase
VPRQDSSRGSKRPPGVLFQSTWTPVDDGAVHAYVGRTTAAGPGSADPLVVLVPGLGLPQYVRPTAAHLVAAGWSCAVLDVPGFRSPAGLSCRPDVESVARVVARWVTAQRVGGPCVLLGHSTGAQVALVAALELQGTMLDLGLVMAGPTFTPKHRRLPGLAAAALTAYRRDSPAELVVVPTALGNARGVWSLIRSGMRDVTERRVRDLRVPLVLTAGKADTLAPEAWLSRLAASAGTAEVPTVRILPGSHNNLFTHPRELAALVTEMSATRGRQPRPSA